MLHFHWRLVREDYALAQVHVTIVIAMVMVVVELMMTVLVKMVVEMAVVIIDLCDGGGEGGGGDNDDAQGHTLGMNAYLGLGVTEERSRDARNK